MNVDRYLFQSPYSSQVQIGRPDPSTAKSEDTKKVDNKTDDTLIKSETASNPLQASSTTEETTTVKPTVEESGNSIDIYA